MRRLDLADRELVQDDFFSQPALAFSFEQFSEQMLLKPSTAETLVDLQAEFNSLKIAATDANQPGETGSTVEAPIDSGWSLAKYY